MLSKTVSVLTVYSNSRND